MSFGFWENISMHSLGYMPGRVLLGGRSVAIAVEPVVLAASPSGQSSGYWHLHNTRFLFLLLGIPVIITTLGRR